MVFLEKFNPLSPLRPSLLPHSPPPPPSPPSPPCNTGGAQNLVNVHQSWPKHLDPTRPKKRRARSSKRQTLSKQTPLERNHTFHPESLRKHIMDGRGKLWISSPSMLQWAKVGSSMNRMSTEETGGGREVKHTITEA